MSSGGAEYHEPATASAARSEAQRSGVTGAEEGMNDEGWVAGLVDEQRPAVQLPRDPSGMQTATR